MITLMKMTESIPHQNTPEDEAISMSNKPFQARALNLVSKLRGELLLCGTAAEVLEISGSTRITLEKLTADTEWINAEAMQHDYNRADALVGGLISTRMRELRMN